MFLNEWFTIFVHINRIFGKMGEEETIISGIEYKVRKLIESLNESESEKEKLLSDKSELKRELEQQKQINKELQEKIKTVKTAKLLESAKGSVEAKNRINELVREIERCIGLLNN